METDGGALRYNNGKSRTDLIPPDAMLALGHVYAYGDQKYGHEIGGARNWERGGPWSTSYAAGLRHAFAWWLGEDANAESGLHHLDHAIWNLIACRTYVLRGIGTDDRNPVGRTGIDDLREMPGVTDEEEATDEDD